MKSKDVIQYLQWATIAGIGYLLLKKFNIISDPVETIGQEQPIWIVDGIGDAPKYNDNNQTCHGGWCYTIKYYDDIATNLYKASSLFNAGNGYSYIIQEFKKCKTKGDVHGVVVTFSKKYNRDLYSYLMNFGGLFPWDGLTDSEMKKLNSFVNSLPTKL
jgi:hypothetical protein